uniref:Peptidase A1 domain-containing protein n=1 Tax=Oryza brachyantha TaxID=4533 RepID=J3N4G9_ORYBR
MGRLVVTILLVLCLIFLTTCSISTRAAMASRAHGNLRRGLERAMRGRLLADGTASPPGGAVVPSHWTPGLYNVANFTIGTPPQAASAFIDLSGELVWTQCSLCRRCFKQDLPVFTPNSSSTFQAAPCGGDVCKSIPTSNCSSNMCFYDGPLTSLGGNTFGFAAADKFTIGTATASLGFGCVVASDIDTMGGPSGFIGLGRTPWSLVAQMKLTKFSYCLVPHDSGKTSRLFLGSSAKLAGGKSATAQLVKTSPGDVLNQDYPLQLEGIKAGDAVISPPQGASTILVHTVAPVSFLVDSTYQDLKKAVMKAVGAAPTSKPVEPFDLCFPKAGVSGAPSIVFTFHGAAALTVEQSRYLIEADKDTLCLAILSTSWLNSTELDEMNILGSLQQENIHMLFDLDKETVSFEPADCSSLS